MYLLHVLNDLGFHSRSYGCMCEKDALPSSPPSGTLDTIVQQIDGAIETFGATAPDRLSRTPCSELQHVSWFSPSTEQCFDMQGVFSGRSDVGTAAVRQHAISLWHDCLERTPYTRPCHACAPFVPTLFWQNRRTDRHRIHGVFVRML